MVTRITTYVAALAVSLAALLSLSPSTCAASGAPEDSSQVAQLFSQAKSHAVALRLDAELMESYTLSKTSWHTQADQIWQIKQHTNDLAKIIQQLNETREKASPWQQEAIDRLNPMLRDLVASVTSMIHCVDEQSSNPIGAGTYRDCVRNNYNLSVEMAGLINKFVSYGSTKSEELGKSLAFSTPR